MVGSRMGAVEWGIMTKRWGYWVSGPLLGGRELEVVRREFGLSSVVGRGGGNE